MGGILSLPVQKMTSQRSALFMARVREACQLMRIRQKDLADSLDLKPSQMNLYFQGKVEMRSDRLLALLDILGVDVERQLEERIKELGGENKFSPGHENKMLATLGRLDDYKKQSLLKIISILGSK